MTNFKKNKLMEKKSKAERENEELLKNFVTRQEMLEDVLPPFKALLSTLLNHVTTLINLLEQKGIFSEEEFKEELQKTEGTLKDARRKN